MSNGTYTPTPEDLKNVIKLLHENGIDVSNSKAAYSSLKAYEGNPQFCVLLAAVYGAQQCPVAGLSLPVPWTQYRQLAAITLKNNLSVAKQALGEAAVLQVARCALDTLCNPPDAQLARASAQIVVRVTDITSFDWWTSAQLGDLADTLLNKLLPGGNLQTLAALHTLQFLMEDMPKQVGVASESIIKRVAELSSSPQVPLDLRKAAFRMCFNVYERSAYLDWNVDVLSPLQQGVANASWSFAQTCTALLEGSCYNDSSLMIAVLRSCLFLLDYCSYFYDSTPAERYRMVQFWVVGTVELIKNTPGGRGNDELLSAAIELTTGIVESYESGAGESPSAFLVEPISASINGLLPALARDSIMADEEVNGIMESDDYRKQEQVPVKFTNPGGKDLAKDEALDDEEAAVTLRRSALRCTDKLCSLASEAAYRGLMEQIKPLWGSENWRAREAGIVLLGTMASNCSVYLKETLVWCVEQLIGFASNVNEHICVSSIAVWSLSRFADEMLLSAPQCWDKYLSTVISRMASPSKRVQHASVSAVREAVEKMHSYGYEDRLMPHFENLLNTIASSLPMYSTMGLSVLVDLTIRLMVSLRGLGAEHMITQLGTLLSQERGKKLHTFEQSYANTFVNEVPNSFVSVDVFSLDRGVVEVLSLQPNDSVAVANLSVCHSVLQDMLNRGLVDEANVILGVLTACHGYFCCISTDAQRQWIRSSSGSFPQSIMQVLAKTSNAAVQSAVVVTLSTLVKTVGAEAVPEQTYDPVLAFLVEKIQNEENAELKYNYVQLAVAILLQNPNKWSTQSTSAVLTAINAALRGDVYGDTQYHFIGIAFEICRLFDAAPTLATSFNMDVISELLGRSENDMDKSEATIRWCSALCNAPGSLLDSLAKRILVVTFSWQQSASHYPGTAEAISAVLRRLSGECGSTFELLLRSYPPQAQQIIRELYFR